MGRRRTSAGEDLIDLVALLPWWLGIALAVTSYLVLHAYASAPLPAPTPGQMHQLASASMIKGVAFGMQYVLPGICVLGAMLSAWRRHQRRQLLGQTVANPTAAHLNSMSWQEFELLVGEAFRQEGYAVEERGGAGADGGVDLVLKRNGEQFLVQCKQWRAARVGVSVVRELYGVMAAAGAAGCFVVTSGRFTEEAKHFAAGRNIKLWDGETLLDRIKSAKVHDVHSATEVVTNGPRTPHAEDRTAPVCPQCAAPMIRRMAKRGENAGQLFWGCSSYPKCRGVRTG